MGARTGWPIAFAPQECAQILFAITQVVPDVTDEVIMTSTTSGGLAAGTSFRPLPPPIPDAPIEAVVDGDPIVAIRPSTVLAHPEIVIVPASDLPGAHPVLPDRVTSRQRAAAWMRAHGGEGDDLAFESDQRSTAWLRSDPPPMLMYTTWLRVMLVLLMFAALGAALWFRYTSDTGDAADAQWVVGLHSGVVGALIVWSFVSMRNADALVPATRYQSRSRGWVAASLWLLAFASPIGAIIASDAARDLFDDPEHPNFIFVQVGIGLVVAAIVWLPFRYLALQASRIGAPRRVMFEWFWVPALAVGGGLVIMVLGLRDDLAADGWTETERLVEAGVVYGLPMLLFTLTAWRATAAFDGVINLRWRRWKNGWDQGVAAFGIADEANS